jgi:hypothetical protein
MDIVLNDLRKIVVDDMRDISNIQASLSYIRRHNDFDPRHP